MVLKELYLQPALKVMAIAVALWSSDQNLIAWQPDCVYNHSLCFNCPQLYPITVFLTAMHSEGLPSGSPPPMPSHAILCHPQVTCLVSPSILPVGGWVEQQGQQRWQRAGRPKGQRGGGDRWVGELKRRQPRERRRNMMFSPNDT